MVMPFWGSKSIQFIHVRRRNVSLSPITNFRTLSQNIPACTRFRLFTSLTYIKVKRQQQILVSIVLAGPQTAAVLPPSLTCSPYMRRIKSKSQNWWVEIKTLIGEAKLCIQAKQMRELNHCFPLAGRYPATSMASEYVMVTWETNPITANIPHSSFFPSAIIAEHNTIYYEISLQ